MRHRSLPLLFAAVAVLGSGGCQQIQRMAFFRHPHVTPVAPPSSAPQSVQDRLYADAADAIRRREYDTALDALQMAKARQPDDARVLNALGVVYDKLGRFDLSARYYAEADKADPGSKVVALNRHYSSLLQQQAAEVATVAPDDVMVLATNSTPRPAATAPRPAAPVRAAPAPLTEDQLYRRAAALIQRRAYGEALNDLQAARADKPDDPRVLCALGVVYDWLGRFDLSAHYYDLAEAADPGSVVVAINRRYSQMLQRHGGIRLEDHVMTAADAQAAAAAAVAASQSAAARPAARTPPARTANRRPAAAGAQAG
jgi:Flp pilus assembly protein TadD